jgi:hypothetical protein
LRLSSLSENIRDVYKKHYVMGRTRTKRKMLPELKRESKNAEVSPVGESNSPSKKITKKNRYLVLFPGKKKV